MLRPVLFSGVLVSVVACGGCGAARPNGEDVDVLTDALSVPKRESFASTSWLTTDDDNLYTRNARGGIEASQKGSTAGRWATAAAHTGTLNVDTRTVGVYQDGSGDLFAPVHHLDRWFTVEVQRISRANGAARTVFQARTTGVSGFKLLTVASGVVYAYVDLPETNTMTMSGRIVAPPYRGIVAIDTTNPALPNLESTNITRAPGVTTLSSGFARSHGFILGNRLHYLGQGLCSTPLTPGPETCAEVPPSTYSLRATTKKVYFVTSEGGGKAPAVSRIYAFEPGVDAAPAILHEQQGVPQSLGTLVLTTKGSELYFCVFGLGRMRNETAFYHLAEGVPVPTEVGRWASFFAESEDITAIAADGQRIFFASKRATTIKEFGGVFSIAID